MPLSKKPTLTQYLIEQRRRYPQASGELNALILDVSIACKAIARAVAFGELGDSMGGVAMGGVAAGEVNVQGEVQKRLDVVSNEMFMRITEWSGHLAGMASEEMVSLRFMMNPSCFRSVGAGLPVDRSNCRPRHLGLP